MGAARNYETRDFPLRTVLIGSFGLVFIMLFFAVLMWWLMLHFAQREMRASQPAHPLAKVEGPQLPPEPRLQANPRQDLLALRAWENEVLTSYGWVDREKGIVRIPIERAMDLIARRGLPARRGAEHK
ncbi:MAG: hypothetical protein D6815_00855 [Candidatus Dadabacteria bacterium]|nr:MAG: hypothetical protein D6815_00855 [Candidatus Dadabacteria bacterium]